MTDSNSATFTYDIGDPESILPHLLALIGTPGSAIDLGGGNGIWCRALRDHGVTKVVCIDAPRDSYADLVIDKESFIPCDLSRQLPSPIESNLALCLETAEHLPSQMAEPIVEFLTASAPIVLFSAAIPGQPGFGHINCQPPIYWRHLFADKGYVIWDAIRPLILHNRNIHYWYRQNLYLYLSRQEIFDRRIEVPQNQFLPDDFEIVHQKILKRYRAKAGLKRLLIDIPGAFVDAVRRRLGAGD